MSPELSQLAKELLKELPWSVVLPAGCGKTELIAAIAANIKQGNKPILVLTHTNAGVDVVRKRFAKYAVTQNQARVFTLDSWAAHFADYFPLLGSSARTPEQADLWLIAKLKAKEVFSSHHIGDIIAATYSAIIVDEYQDCSDLQHDLVTTMSHHIPIGVLGDPLQGIFDFGEGVVDWTKVTAVFPSKSLTPIPHRWANKNPALGQWLLELRSKLKVGTIIDLTASGIPITWRISDWREEGRYCLNAVNSIGNQKQIVALRQQPAQGYLFARGLLGLYDVAEEIQCKVVQELMVTIDEGDGGRVAAAVINFVRDCCTGCPPALNKALIVEYARGNPKEYRKGNRNAHVFDALNTIVYQPTVGNVNNALNVLKHTVQRVFRKEAWRVSIQVLNEIGSNSGNAVGKLLEIRNRGRYGGQHLNRHSISRTLLVKGQEYDECIILGADGMSARNLYVALSRGIDKVTIFSNSPTLMINTY